MKLIKIALLYFFCSAESFAIPNIKNVFKKDIYDQSRLSVTATDAQKQTEFIRQKTDQFNAKILNEKIKEVDAIKKLLEEMLQKRHTASYFVTPTAFVVSEATKRILFPQKLLGLDIMLKLYVDWSEICADPLKYALNEAARPGAIILDRIIPLDKILERLEKQQNLIEHLKRQLTTGVLFDLECRYILNKSTFSTDWQDKIESTFIACYNQNSLQDQEFLESMISHPTEIRILSTEINEDYFTLLQQMTDSLKDQLDLYAIPTLVQDDCADILNAFINCAQATLNEDETELTRHFVYYHSKTLSNLEFSRMTTRIAEAFGVPYRIVDAKNIEPNESFLYGSSLYTTLF